MEALLKSFMEQTEGAGLSDGDYLRACNALKKCFEMIPTTPGIRPRVNDMEFKLEFKCKFGYSLYLDIMKGIRLSGEAPDKVVYTLRVSKDCTIVKEQVNMQCTIDKMSSMIENICLTYFFDTFTITNSVGSTEYDLQKVLEGLNEKYDRFNELIGEDRDPEILTKNEHYIFITEIFHLCFEESKYNLSS